jgi:hypothetical protein
MLPREGQIGVLRSFIAEGVPSSFEQLPVLYEVVRDFLAVRLQIQARDITLIGSAKLGYCMAPSGYGRPFNSDSDLDFAVLSRTLFERLVDVFRQWQQDFATGRETLSNAREEGFWLENLKVVPKNIDRGFIDSNKIPNRYGLSMTVNQTLWLLKERLRVTIGAPTVRRATLRVYRDSDAFFRQQHLNLGIMLRRIP